MTKRTLLAVLVFAILLAAAVASLRKKPERNITRISFASVDKERIDRLEISGKNPLEASKKDGKWILADGREAEESAIQGALDGVAKLESSDLVTSNGDRFAELEVDDAKGTRVKALSGSAIVAEFVIGKSGAAGTYVRKGDAVYAAKGVYSHFFSKPAAQWHHLKLFTDKLDDVTRLEVALAGAAPYALVKKDDKWQLEGEKIVPDGFRFDESAARSMASSLVTATAKEIADKDPGAEATKLDDKADVLVFVLKDGARRELRLGGAAPGGGVWARLAGKSDLLTLAEPLAKGLRRSALDLRDLTLMKLEKDQVQKLEIADGKVRLVLEKQGTDWKIASSTEPAPADFSLDPALVERRIASLASARALKLAGAGPTGLEKATSRIAASAPGGTAVLAFGAAVREDSQDGFFARGNADASAYVVAKPVRDGLMGGLMSFKKRPEQPMRSFDPSALQNLPPDVRANLMQQLARQAHPGPGAKVPPPPPPSTGK